MANLSSAIQALRKENKDNAERTIAVSKENKEQLMDLNTSVGDLVSMFRANTLKDEENRREQTSRPSTQTPSGPSDSGGLSDLPSSLGIGGIIAALSGAIAGLVAGIARDIKNLAKSFTGGKVFAELAKSFKNVTNAFKAGMNGIKGLSRAADGSFRQLNMIEKAVRGLGSIFGKAVKGVKAIGATLRNFGKNLLTSVKNVLTTIKNTIMKPINFIVDGTKSVISMLKLPGGGGFKEMFKPVTEFFKRFANIFGKVFTVFKNIGSKIFFPITLIMGIIDGITGAVDGFARQGDRGGSMADKVIGGITGIFGGIVSGLIGGILDLGKDLISWVAGALGFENVEATLDGFSFAESITSIFNGFADILVSLKDRVLGFFSTAFDEITTPIMNIFNGEGSLGDNLMDLLGSLASNILMAPINMIKGVSAAVLNAFGVSNNLDDIDLAMELGNKLKEIARAVLPDPDGLVGKFVVPDAVYEWAGIDPDTGDVVGTAGEATSATRKALSGATVEELDEAKQGYTDRVNIAAKEYGKDSLQYQNAAAEMKEFERISAKARLNADNEYTESREYKEARMREDRVAPPPVKEKEVITQDLDRMTQENKEADKQSAVVVAPSTNVSTTNNTSTTAAVVDNNTPTRDYNDRIYSDWVAA